MKILISGATGFVGKKLVSRLLEEGNKIVVLSRSQKTAIHQFPVEVECYAWDPMTEAAPLYAFQDVEAVINLAGEDVSRKRWTKQQKKQILDSRVIGTRNLVSTIRQIPSVKTLISASAVGIYGDRGDESLDEYSTRGFGFLADVCTQWEKEVQNLPEEIRVVNLRIGVVLGSEGGALTKMLLPFRLGLGAFLGSGQQWMSWIHIDDLVGLTIHCLKNNTLLGPVAAVSPTPVTNKLFSRTLGRVLHRPAFFRIPAWVLRMAMGRMSEIILGSQRVFPRDALKSSYTFKFSTLDNALINILKARDNDNRLLEDKIDSKIDREKRLRIISDPELPTLSVETKFGK